MLELLKVMVQPVVLERDEHGAVIGERLGEATALYGRAQVLEFLDALEGSLAIENGSQASANGKAKVTRRREKANVVADED
jgi:hypothetical protein